MNGIGLNFMVGQMPPMIILMSEVDAEGIIEAWRTGKIPDIIGGISLDRVRWAVKTNAIQAIHTVELSKLGQMGLAQTQSRLGQLRPGSSGHN